jgi:hypothetical protein
MVWGLEKYRSARRSVGLSRRSRQHIITRWTAEGTFSSIGSFGTCHDEMLIFEFRLPTFLNCAY